MQANCECNTSYRFGVVRTRNYWGGFRVNCTHFPMAMDQEKSLCRLLGTTLTTRAFLVHLHDSHGFARESFAPRVFGRGVRDNRTGP
jgi:hypothetical protein